MITYRNVPFVHRRTDPEQEPEAGSCRSAGLPAILEIYQQQLRTGPGLTSSHYHRAGNIPEILTAQEDHGGILPVGLSMPAWAS